MICRRSSRSRRRCSDRRDAPPITSRAFGRSSTSASRRTRVGVLGAGAMDAGIAQVAAAGGHSVVVVDTHPPSIDKARDGIRLTLARDVEKGRLTAEDAQYIERRLRFVASNDDVSAFSGCGLVIEAIVEDLDAKQRAFRQIESVVGEDCVLATNTSSLSVAAIASACKERGRV